jgi:histidine phosphotransferase ChpT
MKVRGKTGDHMADYSGIDFASLLCSRLCHDLLNPVGALNNGLELLADETDAEMREQCMNLLAESARTTASKLKFYRLAFGSAGGFGDVLPAHELKSAVEGMFATSGKVAISWLPVDDSIGKLPAKILLNLALIAGEALPRGGTLTLGLESRDGASDVAVHGEGPRMTLDPDLRRALLGELDRDGITSRTVAATMVRNLVSERGGDVITSDTDQPFIMFGARIPS